MSRNLRIHMQAERDRDRIFSWLANRSPRGASAWYDAFSAKVDQIAANPDSYPVACDAVRRWNRDIRQVFFKTRRGRRYRIVFELTETEIRILRIRGPGQPPLRRNSLPTN